MLPSEFEENREGYERVLEVLKEHPDEKVSAGIVEVEFENPDWYDISLIEDLILLGEIELCQLRGMTGRIWLKRRNVPKSQEERYTVSRSIWQGYVAEDFQHRMADRIFTTRKATLLHLVESYGTNPADFEPLSFLDDVWVADTGEFDGLEGGTAVIRRETIYQTSNVDQRLENYS